MCWVTEEIVVLPKTLLPEPMDKYMHVPGLHFLMLFKVVRVGCICRTGQKQSSVFFSSHPIVFFSMCFSSCMGSSSNQCYITPLVELKATLFHVELDVPLRSETSVCVSETGPPETRNARGACKKVDVLSKPWGSICREHSPVLILTRHN